MDIDKILKKHFNTSEINSIKSNPLKTDRAKVVIADSLSPKLLDMLFNRKLCAIHIPGYFSKALAKQASKNILKSSKIYNWGIPDGNKGIIKTDMNYSIGFPRQMALVSEKNSKKYISEAIPSTQKIRALFAPFLSPLDKLRLELDEFWPAGVEVMPFKGEKGLAGLTRTMKPENFFSGIAKSRGVCHMDASVDKYRFSANMYVSVPKSGGNLRIWNIRLNKEASKLLLYQLIHSGNTFNSDAQEIIHRYLPEAMVITPKPGDLVLIDSSRPHAVAGFSAGVRMSVQTFIEKDPKTGRLSLVS